LVSSGSMNLLPKRTKLVKKRRKPINKPQRHQLHILIGDYQNNIGDTLAALIENFAEDKYELKVMTALFAKELLGYAQDHEFDIFIPIINNILFSSANLPAKKRVEKALKLITHFRRTYKKPIIAFFGWPDDLSFAEKAKKAGANFAFKITYKTEDFNEAVRKCLDKIA